MMARLNISILQLLIPFTLVFGQGEANKWLAGYHVPAGPQPPWGVSMIDFNPGFPDTSITTIPMSFRFTCAIANDSAGNLLFYTNGVYIADASHDTMLNGSGINPGPYVNTFRDAGLRIPQGDIIIRDPGNLNEYYLFHETATYDSNIGSQVEELYYSKIDMSLNGGLGAVTSKNNVLLHDTLLNGAITAVRHANGRDWWLQFHRWNSSTFVRYLITSGGIQGPFYQTIGSHSQYGSTGGAIFSPDGSKFVHSNIEMEVDLFDFDRCTGELSNLVHFHAPQPTYAIHAEFSPNNRFLYVNTDSTIYQYDLHANNIFLSRLTVAEFDTFADPGPPFWCFFDIPKLGPDNKIYYAPGNTCASFHVINDPDSLGRACNVTLHSLALPSYCAWTIPNFYNFWLGKIPGSDCDSLIDNLLDLPVENFSFKIFPNPSDGIVDFEFHSHLEQNFTLNIFNSEGKNFFQQIIQKNESTYRMPANVLKPGFYIAELRSNRSAYRQKLIVE